jgi:PAS domain-containing protein
VRGLDGRVLYVLHQTEDVTARVHSEQAAARAERRAEGILERVADAHCILDREFRIVA